MSDAAKKLWACLDDIASAPARLAPKTPGEYMRMGTDCIAIVGHSRLVVVDENDVGAMRLLQLLNNICTLIHIYSPKSRSEWEVVEEQCKRRFDVLRACEGELAPV